ncbi:hypothetical protein AAG570_002879 [Ranatra chinensis]|uniref:DUF4211 domain-containing protein n=1 Tax=Ranatra chinensis TaxID=642074 RepID=A0ABD0YTM0_9HEMI
MDPVGSWSAYAASYNRLANAAGGFAQGGSGSGGGGGGAGPDVSSVANTGGGNGQTAAGGGAAQLLLQAAAVSTSPFNHGGFLSPPPTVAYDVFSPLFHQKAHYGSLNHPRLKSDSDISSRDSFNQIVSCSSFFEQGTNSSTMAWSAQGTSSASQLPSPFGILPHESVVSTTAAAKSYDNFNPTAAHFASLNQLPPFQPGDAKKRPPSPSLPKATNTSANFFQHNFPELNPPNFKAFENGQQHQPQHPAQEYRIPQPPRSQFPPQKNRSPYPPPQVVDKPANKPVRGPIADKGPDSQESQSSPISFAIMDAGSPRNYQKMRSSGDFPQANYRYPEGGGEQSPPAFYGTGSAGTEISRAPGVVYPSVITRTEKNYPQWEDKQKKVGQYYDQAALNSCRDDPMSLVKTLHQQQPPEEKSIPKKRRKSLSAEPRVPPPAHISTNQTNGAPPGAGYMDFERWNLPPPGNFVAPSNAPPPQLMVPYIPPLQPTPPPEDQTQLGKEEQPPDRESGKKPEPQVVVPDIEEELDFLTEDLPTPPPKTKKKKAPPPLEIKPNPNNSCFLMSFEKFLSGDTEELSPPPMPRRNSWKNYEPQETTIVAPLPKEVSSEPPPLPDEHTVEGDPQDDPRYFPLPKTSENRTFDSSEDDEDEFTIDAKAKRTEIEPEAGEKKPNEDEPTDQKETPVPVSSPPASPPSPPKPLRFKSKAKIKRIQMEMEREKEMEIEREKQQQRESDLEGENEDEQHEFVPVEAVEAVLSEVSSDESDVPKRRTSSRRKAKDKQLINYDKYYDDDESVPEDSDSDPAWTPQYDSPPDDIMDTWRRRKTKRTPKKRARGNYHRTYPSNLPGGQGGIGGYIGHMYEPSDTKNSTPRSETSGGNSPDSSSPPPGSNPPLRHGAESPILPAKMKPLQVTRKIVTKLEIKFPFPVGDFVVSRADIHKYNPPIWRVKEKAILQKYQHMVRDGVTLYSNLPSYTGWSPESKNVYSAVPVKIVSQNKSEIVVHPVHYQIREPTPESLEIMAKCIEDTDKFQDNFEVYIQTLFSQALDSNFLTEIFVEKGDYFSLYWVSGVDDYFLSNVSTVDRITQGYKDRLVNALGWQELGAELTKRPNYRRTPCGAGVRPPAHQPAAAKPATSGPKCGTSNCDSPAVAILELSGLPYHSDTLQIVSDKLRSVTELYVCGTCCDRVELAHRLSHQKCALFAHCEERVRDKRIEDPNKDTTQVLNELLADEAWLGQIYNEVRSTWGLVDVVVQELSQTGAPRPTPDFEIVQFQPPQQGATLTPLVPSGSRNLARMTSWSSINIQSTKESSGKRTQLHQFLFYRGAEAQLTGVSRKRGYMFPRDCSDLFFESLVGIPAP